MTVERLIVTWDWSNSECCGTEVVCVRYESAEALYAHLDEAIRAYVESRSEYEAKLQTWDKEYSKALHEFTEADVAAKKRRKREEDENRADNRLQAARQKLNDVWKAGPAQPTGEFVLAGRGFNLNTFFDGPPQVLALDEWFERSAPENQEVKS